MTTETKTKHSIIKARISRNANWLYVGADGLMVSQRERAERLDPNEAGRRLLTYLNDYPGWSFEEEADL